MATSRGKTPEYKCLDDNFTPIENLDLLVRQAVVHWTRIGTNYEGTQTLLAEKFKKDLYAPDLTPKDLRKMYVCFQKTRYSEPKLFSMPTSEEEYIKLNEKLHGLKMNNIDLGAYLMEKRPELFHKEDLPK